MTAARRKHISLLTKLHAALYQLGFEPHEVELDHAPALALREWDEAAQDTIPPASDPRYLVWMPKADHAVKTRGAGATTAGSDIGKMKKLRHLVAKETAFRERVLAKGGKAIAPKPKKPKRAWPSRPFPHQKKRSKRS